MKRPSSKAMGSKTVMKTMKGKASGTLAKMTKHDMKKPAFSSSYGNVKVPTANDPALNEIRTVDNQGYDYKQVEASLAYEYNDSKAYTESFKTMGPNGK